MKTVIKEMKKGIFPNYLIKSIVIDYDGERDYKFVGDAVDLVCETQAYRIACNLVKNSRPHQYGREVYFFAGHSATKMVIELKAAE